MASKKTYLEIINRTSFSLYTTVDGTDSYDWDGSSRPDHNFNPADIPPNGSKKEREEINAHASTCPFTMHIRLSNGQELSFRSDQRDALKRSYQFFPFSGPSEDYLLCQINEGNDTNTFVLYPFSLKQWMAKLPDSTSLLNLSLPGTHDSCALSNGFTLMYAKCQEWRLSEQYAHGVRYVDIRGEAHDNQTITIKHGIVSQPYNFDEVLSETVDFLRHNSREVVFMQVKQESSEWSGDSYAALVKKYLEKDEYRDYLYYDAAKLNLEHTRGKIVLVNRFFDSPEYGINVSDWSDDTSFSKNKGVPYNVEDHYHVCNAVTEYARDKKMSYVNEFFSQFAFRKNELNICFCSAECVPVVSPVGFAAGNNGINERTARQHLIPKRGWNGAVLFDFVDSFSALTIPSIIENNRS
jgi:1-phosphatidylinositol phosphodiesterase